MDLCGLEVYIAEVRGAGHPPEINCCLLKTGGAFLR